jgi:hypothetical protein
MINTNKKYFEIQILKENTKCKIVVVDKSTKFDDRLIDSTNSSISIYRMKE